MIFVACLAVAAAAMAACNHGPDAPGDHGVCWRELTDAAGKQKFEVISRNVENLDSCAAQIEGLRLQERRDVSGAYQSFFISADDESVSSSSRRGGFRYPIFLPAQRQVIDDGLRRMIEQNHGKAPKASDLAIDKAQ